MAASTPQLHPFTAQVVDVMRTLYPEELADRSWDNVGLLLENVKPDHDDDAELVPTVLVTNDLTESVAEEAIRRKATVIVSYHPFLFRPIKSISLSDPHQRIILRLVQNNIAVYSPHTAVDAAPGGMTDWLADMVKDVCSVPEASRKVVHPLPPSQSARKGAGYGRVVYLSRPVDLEQVIRAYAAGLGDQRYLMVARPKHLTKVRAVAVCPGSGYDVLKDCDDVDVIVTGEVTHHNALRAVMQGRCVITAFHSNSERAFLRDRLLPRLRNMLTDELPQAVVLLSELDEDPFEICDMQNFKFRS